MILLIYIEGLGGDNLYLFTEHLYDQNISNICMMLDNWYDTSVTRIKATRVVDAY